MKVKEHLNLRVRRRELECFELKQGYRPLSAHAEIDQEFGNFLQ